MASEAIKDAIYPKFFSKMQEYNTPLLHVFAIASLLPGASGLMPGDLPKQLC
jgi:hypothetical protein